MARLYPVLAPLHELRASLSQMRLESLAVGADGRNRTLSSAFRARTGRSQPSNTKSVFGPTRWIRHLIRPPEGHGLAYVDWEQQEVGIAAGLSRDAAMIEAYLSGDPYLEFGKQAGALPSTATKKTHGPEREQFKACVLGVLYGMGCAALAFRAGVSLTRAAELLALHKATYPRFWAWSQSAVDCALLTGRLTATFGWTIQVASSPNPRSLANYPMQANGAEMLRLAACFATEAGIEVCATVHDAVLITAALDYLDQDVVRTQEHMRRASTAVLGGFELRSDAKIVRHPDRYEDERGAAMWNTVWETVRKLEAKTTRPVACAPLPHKVSAAGTPVQSPFQSIDDGGGT